MAEQNGNNQINSSISKISQLHTLTADFLTDQFKKKGFSEFASSHGNILFQLSVHEKMKMGELAAKINRDKSTTTVLVRKLISLNLIREENDEKDKRNKYITLTQQGKEYNSMTAELSSQLIDTFYKGFSEDEKNEFCSYLNRILENFKS